MNKILLLIFSLFFLSVSAQKTAKLYQKAQTAFDHREFYDAISILDRLPKDEKSSASCYRLISLSFDSLRRYSDAIRFYTLYLSGTQDSVCSLRLTFLKAYEEKRLAAIKAKFEKIKDCPKCHGTDSVPMDIVCRKCTGFKITKKRCTRCRGTGTMTCGACGGTGTVASGSSSASCTRCGATGGQPCSMSCDRGYIIEDCKTCSGLGYETVEVKCDKHE
jgi:hypothetical protein